MSNEVASTDLVELLKTQEVGKYEGDDAFASMSSGGFLPRIMLMGSNSGAVKEGAINQGHYGLVRSKTQIDDLGKDVPCLPLAWRSKAMDVSDVNSILTVYDFKSAEFNRIAAASEVKDSGCMFGPEYLVWLPSAKCFATFYMSSKTARREAPLLRDLIGKPAFLKSHLIKTPRFSWFGPVVTICSAPFPFPDPEEIMEQVGKFKKPPASEMEAAPDVGRDR